MIIMELRLAFASIFKFQVNLRLKQIQELESNQVVDKYHNSPNLN